MNWKELRNWFSFVFGIFGAVLVFSKLLVPLDIWNHGDWIQFVIAMGTTVIGGAAVWVAFRQNKILESQNELMAQQNNYLANQKELNDLLIKQELDREHERIKTWCKNVLNSTSSPGGLQTAGNNLRRRFPGSIPIIIEALEEAKNEDPKSPLPTAFEFVESMKGSSDSEHWPDPSEYWLRPRQ